MLYVISQDCFQFQYAMQMHIVGKRRIAEQSENKHAAIGCYEKREMYVYYQIALGIIHQTQILTVPV